MRILSLKIRGFRNIASLAWRPAPGLCLVAGDNGQGKTNLLEAIYLGLLGRSFRARREVECLPWTGGGGSAAVAEAVGGGEPDPDAPRLSVEIEVEKRVGRAIIRAVMGKGIKRLWRDGALIERLADLWDATPLVVFTPADVELFRGSPAERRRALDLALCQVSRPYLESLRRYQKALKQANAALKSRSGGDAARREQAEAFYPIMAEAGEALMREREARLAEIRPLAAETHAELGGSGALDLQYQPHHKGPEPLLDRLVRAHDESARQGAVAAGPHRDDLRARLEGRDLGRFGSQGQNRLAALAHKLATARWMESALGESPLLLLDDFGSELDPDRRRATLTRLRGRMQVIVTATRAEDLGGEAMFDEARIMRAGNWEGE